MPPLFETMSVHNRYRLGGAIAIFAALALLPVSPALGQSDPVGAQYDNAAAGVAGQAGGGPGGSEGSSESQASGLESSVAGGLPFTGLDLIVIAGVAIMLSTVGLTLRRLTATKHPT